MSHYQPKRTMVFLSTTAEEYGLTNSWYDWCVGAWHFITQKHPSWSGRIAGMLNTEIVGYKDGNLWMLASPEITPMLERAARRQRRPHAHPQRHRPGRHRRAVVLERPVDLHRRRRARASRSGRRTTTTAASTRTTIYHTQYDTASLINWPFFRDIAKFQFRVAKKFDKGLLPYTLATRSAGPRRGARDADRRGPGRADRRRRHRQDGGQAGLRPLRRRRRPVRRGLRHLRRPRRATSRPPTAPAANAQLMRIEKLINTSFTSLDWLDNTTFPFDQVSRDIYHMQMAIDALQERRPGLRHRRGGDRHDRPHVVRHQLQPSRCSRRSSSSTGPRTTTSAGALRVTSPSTRT